MEHDEPAAEQTAAPSATVTVTPTSATVPPTSATVPPTSATPTPPETPAGSRPPDMVGWAVQRIRRRREKIAAEIERNRRGEPAVPTWVLAALLVAILGGWAALVVLS